MKPFWNSKTILFNLFTGALATADVFPPQWGALIIAVANIGLRFVTTQGVSVTGK